MTPWLGKRVSIEGASIPALLPAVAVLLITLFTWSLAVAAPLPDDAKVWLARGDVTGIIANPGIRPANGTSESEAALFSAPMTTPRYGFDRLYRYELQEPRTRLYVPARRETN